MVYQIITASNERELSSLVNLAITQGWIPTGGLALDDSGFYQAMIKETTV